LKVTIIGSSDSWATSVCASPGAVDEVAGGGDPVVLQVAPLAGDRVREDLVRVVVAVDEARLGGAEDVAPAVLARQNEQRPRPDRLGQRDVVALVVGGRVLEVDLGERVRLEDVRDRLQVAPELGPGHGSPLVRLLAQPPAIISR
jgi:hypothetical protein